MDLADALDRVGARPIAQRAGLIGEPARPLRSDSPEVRQLLSDPGFVDRLGPVADRLGRSVTDVLAEAAGYLREMSTMHAQAGSDAWRGFGRWLSRAHDLIVDDEGARRLRSLDRKHSLVFLFSHRSYLDGWMVPAALAHQDIKPTYTMGGGNLNFFPFNTLARRAGVVFIRRATQDLPVYRLCLRSYITQLVRNQRNLGWAIEGGRTRTGKLRPPTYGILRYVLDAAETAPGPEVLVIPVSVVYEQLHEVALMTAEARGASKRSEDLRWLVGYGRAQRQRLGRAYLNFGEPISLRQRASELRADDPASPHIVERLALDTMHRINRATPVTATAMVCLAMLAADRGLTHDQVVATVAPLARYMERRRWPAAGGANLTDRATIRRTLQELTASQVLVAYDGGTETIWSIAPDQHLIAAFYRNTAVHVLVDRAIGELGILAAIDSGEEGRRTAIEETLRLRELLKFDFFFSSREDFAADMHAELAIIDPSVGGAELPAFDTATARRWLCEAQPLVAHLVLRPYLEAYHLVADRLAARDPDEPFHEAAFLDECLRVGRQWVMQRMMASEESLTLELFRPALQLARRRDLLQPNAPDLPERRRAFAAELAGTVRLVNVIADMAEGKTTIGG